MLSTALLLVTIDVKRRLFAYEVIMSSGGSMGILVGRIDGSVWTVGLSYTVEAAVVTVGGTW